MLFMSFTVPSPFLTGRGALLPRSQKQRLGVSAGLRVCPSTTIGHVCHAIAKRTTSPISERNGKKKRLRAVFLSLDGMTVCGHTPGKNDIAADVIVE